MHRPDSPRQAATSRRLGLSGVGRRWLGLLAGGALALIVLLVLLAGGSLAPRDRTWERVRSEGVLRVGLDASFPPFEVVAPESGEIVGFDVDLAVALGQELGGIRPQFLNVGFDGLYDALLAGRFDAIISALPVDRTWTEDVRYSRPYFEAGLVIVTRPALSGQIGRADDLAGRAVAVEWGSEGDAYGRRLARRLRELRLAPYATPAEALDAVARGDVDAGLVDAVSAYQLIGGREGAALSVVGDPLTEVSYAVAVRYSSPTLAKEIDAALGRLQDAGALEALVAQWF